MYPSDAEWATIPPRRPDGTEPGDGWGLWATVGAVLLVVAGLVGLAIYLGEGRTRSRVEQTIGPEPPQNVRVIPAQDCRMPPEGIGSTDLYAATLTAADTQAMVGGRILGDVQLSAGGGAAGWRVPHADGTATVHWEPSDSRVDVLFAQGDIPLAMWRGNAKVLTVTDRLPADALVCITYGQGGQYQQCKLPAEWVGR